MIAELQTQVATLTQDLRAGDAVAAELARQKLASALPITPSEAIAWLLRPHEILEDALRDSLSGNDDYGSGTGLESVTADVMVTRHLLALGPITRFCQRVAGAR